MAARNTGPLLRLHPGGFLLLDDGELQFYDLDVLGQALDTAEDQVGFLRLEMLPDRAGALLERWETVYDVHRTAGKTDQQRRYTLLARRRFLPDFRPDTIETILETVSQLELDVYEPFAFRCDDPDSLCDDPDDLVDGAFTFVVDGSAVEARTESPDIDQVEEIIELVKPAHTIGIVRWDDYRCDDEYSRTDRDLLGV